MIAVTATAKMDVACFSEVAEGNARLASATEHSSARDWADDGEHDVVAVVVERLIGRTEIRRDPKRMAVRKYSRPSRESELTPGLD